MATAYPAAIDSFSNPTAGSPTNSPSHAGQHSNANDAIEALETELGAAPRGAFATVRQRLEALELFDPRAYGAVGDGVDAAADTTGFQNAISSAILNGGAVYLPRPPVAWRLADTIHLEPASGTSFSLDIVGRLGNMQIIPTWSTDGKAMFKSRGWKRGTVSGVPLATSLLAGAHSGTVGWDIDADATYTSSGNVRFVNCPVNFQGLGTDHIAYRLGHSGNYDVSAMVWDSCKVTGKTQLGTQGEKGWSLEGQNTMCHTWINCEATSLDKIVSNIPSPGGPAYGSGNFQFIGLVSQYCALVLEYARSWQSVTFLGGRHENGTTFLRLLNAADPTLGVPIGVHDVHLAAFSADTQFDIQGAVSLTLDNLLTDDSGSRRGSPFNANFVRFNPANASSRSHLRVKGGMHYGTSPIHTVVSGDVTVDQTGLVLTDANMQTIGRG